MKKGYHFWVLVLSLAAILAVGDFVLVQFSWPSPIKRVFLTTIVLAVALFALALTSVIRTASVVAAGALLNFLVMAANGAAMPVSFDTTISSRVLSFEVTEDQIGELIPNSKDVLLRQQDIRLPWLADRFHTWTPVQGDNVYSLGDFVLYSGYLLVAIEVTIIFVRNPRGGPSSRAGVRMPRLPWRGGTTCL
ncbi:MAG TPA: DUF5317 family protein [Dehalococcoidia bacterium]|nr:DUF5317 family protein [Dehalococcoidia bacterium]